MYCHSRARQPSKIEERHLQQGALPPNQSKWLTIVFFQTAVPSPSLECLPIRRIRAGVWRTGASIFRPRMHNIGFKTNAAASSESCRSRWLKKGRRRRSTRRSSSSSPRWTLPIRLSKRRACRWRRTLRFSKTEICPSLQITSHPREAMIKAIIHPSPWVWCIMPSQCLTK